MFLTAMKFRVQFQPFFLEKFELCTKKCLQKIPKMDLLDSIHLLLGVNHLGKFLASLGILQHSTLSRLSRPGEKEQNSDENG